MIPVEQMRPYEVAAFKEAVGMSDSFSSGSVFPGRTAAILAAVTVLALLLHLI